MAASKKKNNSNENGKRKKNGNGYYSDEIKELARARVAAGEKLSDVARDLKLAKSTLHGWLNGKVREKHQEVRENRKVQFINKAWDSVENALLFANQKVRVATVAQESFYELIENFTELLQESKDVNAKDVKEVVVALASLMDIPLNHASTYIGTIYDKIALASGEPTAREEVASTVNHKTDLSSLTDKELEDLECIITKATATANAPTYQN